MPRLAADFEQVKALHFALWHATNRPFGFEVVDARYGGCISRIQSAQIRLADYLEGKIAALPELEEKRLQFNGAGIPFCYNALHSAFLTRGF